MNVLAFARDLPKVELHCHLEGAARPSTIADLARANGVTLPTDDPMELFEFTDLDQFLAIYGIVCASLVTADDFRRLTYEALEDAVSANVRYREMFFSPGFVMALGVPVETVWDGIRAGLADAHHDLDVRCRMILDVDKPAGPGPAAELIEFAGTQDRDLLIGVGGDNSERGVDHRAFAPVFARAAELGLHRTFHAGEDGPADNIAAAIDDLGCERIDHGFRLLDDPALAARVADTRVPLTVCPISNVVIANVIDDVADHPFAKQRETGVLVTVNSDDPGMMGTTICDDYEAVTDRFDYDADTIEDIALDAITASWAPAGEQAALRARFVAEMATLRERHGIVPRGA